jgi:TM2 domain-containing membrane protein YozV
MKSQFVAYLCWLPGLCLVCGLHRLYCGKVFTGVLWFFTIGLCGVGQILDFFLIPDMVMKSNLMLLAGTRNTNTNVVNVHVNTGSSGKRRKSTAPRGDFDFDDD